MHYFNYLEKEGVITKKTYKNHNIIQLTSSINILRLPLNHGFLTNGRIIWLGKTKVGIMSDTNVAIDIDGFLSNFEKILTLYE